MPLDHDQTFGHNTGSTHWGFFVLLWVLSIWSFTNFALTSVYLPHYVGYLNTIRGAVFFFVGFSSLLSACRPLFDIFDDSMSALVWFFAIAIFGWIGGLAVHMKQSIVSVNLRKMKPQELAARGVCHYIVQCIIIRMLSYSSDCSMRI